MKKYILLWISLFLFPLSLVAQESTLAKLYKWLDASNGIQIQFLYSIGDYHNQYASYYGYGKKFYLESELLRAWYDGADLWVYMAQNGEVNLTTPEPADLSEINPLLNLKGINTKDYKISERTEGDRIIIKALSLQSSDIEWIEVILSKEAMPLSLTMKEKGMEENVTVTIRSLRQGAFKEMQQKDFYRFTKNKLPNVAVIDLR